MNTGDSGQKDNEEAFWGVASGTHTWKDAGGQADPQEGLGCQSQRPDCPLFLNRSH